MELTDGVVTGEAVCSQSHLQAGDEVIHAHGAGEVLGHLDVPAGWTKQYNVKTRPNFPAPARVGCSNR